MFIKSLHPAPTGTLLKIECEVDKGPKAIRAVARVVWHREQDQPHSPSGMGVKFVKLDPDSASLIAEIVAKSGVLEGTDSERPRRSSVPGARESGRPVSQRPPSGDGANVLLSPSNPAEGTPKKPSEPQVAAAVEKVTSVPPAPGVAAAAGEILEGQDRRATTSVPSPRETPAPRQASISVESGAAIGSANISSAVGAVAKAPKKEADGIRETPRPVVAGESVTGAAARELIGATPIKEAPSDALSSRETMDQAAPSRRRPKMLLAAIVFVAAIAVIAAFLLQSKETNSTETNHKPVETTPVPPAPRPAASISATQEVPSASAPTPEAPTPSKPAESAPLSGPDRLAAAKPSTRPAALRDAKKTSNAQPATEAEPTLAIDKKRPPKKEQNKLAPLEKANACLIAGDNQCAISALEGKAGTPAELGLLIESYRAVGQKELAYKNMDVYVKKYPKSRRSAIYRTILELRAR
jgi:hypothetical protein